MRKTISTLLLLVIVFTVKAQKIQYHVSFPNAIHHEAVINVTASGIALRPAVFKMSRSSPGRYATHEFGKNVYDVKAFDKNKQPLAVSRVDGDIYEVPKHSGYVKLTYTLYGNYGDGTYTGIDPESIHFNMPATFMWMKGMDEAPIEISFDLPKENKGIIATQLVPTAKPNTFTAPGLQYFMDSPTKIGDIKMRQWQVTNTNGKNITFRLALEARATESAVDSLADVVKKIVAKTKEVYGSYPDYDYGTYTFIASINPYVYGDGMEHRNSTMISIPMQFAFSEDLLDVFAHEFFHCWNVERIRPKTLEPFNFEKSNMSNELWCAEGFTQYYGNLNLARAGLMDEKTYLSVLAGLINTKSNTPGGKYYTPVQASNHAVFVDAAVSIDKNNYTNMYSSYYPYGAAIALALDLELQTRYNKTLDAYMQVLWQRFGKTEIPYTVATLQDALASITDNTFAADFFTKYINGHETIDYATLLSKAGYELKKANEGKPSMGVNTRLVEGKFVISFNTQKGSAAYEAGLDVNDELLQLDTTTVKKPEDLTAYLATKKPGETIAVTYKHRGIERKTMLVLKEQLFPALVPYEKSGKEVTEDMKKIRASWFGK